MQRENFRGAACAGIDNPDIFFSLWIKDQQEALFLCDQCPLKQECLQYSIDTNQEYGIFGGKTPEERGFYPV